MKITAAEVKEGKLVLTTSPSDAGRFAFKFQPGNYELKKKSSPRSLTANAYAWVLIGKIAEATGYKRDDVYRDAVQQVGGNFYDICIKKNAVEKFKAGWEAQGLGWQVIELESKLPKCSTLHVYYGSSSFDTREMSRLIDGLVSDCKALDIETLPPEKIAGLIGEWRQEA